MDGETPSLDSNPLDVEQGVPLWVCECGHTSCGDDTFARCAIDYLLSHPFGDDQLALLDMPQLRLIRGGA